MTRTSLVLPVAAALLLGAGPGPARAADEPAPGVPGVMERLGATVPGDLVLRDEAGAPVRLGELLDRPVLLALVYFRCAGICSPLLNSLSHVVERTGLVPGRDFRVVTVSFDDRDGPSIAENKRRNYLAGLAPGFPPDAWRFLTGEAAATRRLADAVGFGFRREGEDFVHPAVVTVLAPGGKVVRYLYGLSFLPFDVKMSLVEAARGREVPTATRILQLCYAWDPGARTYALDATRLLGVATLAVLALVGARLVLRGRRRGEAGEAR
jgi:protein SCO1/2